MKIRTWILAALSALALVSCEAAKPVNFANMTPVELEAYNEGKPILDQIYCREERRTGSHIRRKWCRTVQDWVEHNVRTMMALDTISVRSGSVFRGGN